MKSKNSYKEKKEFFNSLLTLYGRQVVKEVLEDESIDVYKLHLAKTNRFDDKIKKIINLATNRGIEILYHDKKELSRISKNAKQDQGVAIDTKPATFKDAKEIKNLKSYKLIAVDGIQNPQNLGMIIRVVAGSEFDGIIIPKKNTAKISPLVIKASAGTFFKVPVYHCETLEDVLKDMDDVMTVSLSSYAKDDIYNFKPKNKTIFVFGNESEGVSKGVEKLCNTSLKIPLQRGVESLNVATAAAIVAFMRYQG